MVMHTYMSRLVFEVQHMLGDAFQLWNTHSASRGYEKYPKDINSVLYQVDNEGNMHEYALDSQAMLCSVHWGSREQLAQNMKW